MHGWQLIRAARATDRSMTSWTRLSRSCIRASTVTEPGVTFSSRSISSALPKLSRATPSCFDRSFVLNTFSPSSISR